MGELSKSELKDIFKEAVKEWMNERFAEFGKWSARALGVAAMGALIYLILWAEGFHK